MKSKGLFEAPSESVETKTEESSHKNGWTLGRFNETHKMPIAWKYIRYKKKKRKEKRN